MKQTEDRLKLKSIRMAGFKSIDQEGQTIPFGDITVLIGANGSGKSNIISFFEMLKAIANGRFQNYLAFNGEPNKLLHYGTKNNPLITIDLVFESSMVQYYYDFTLQLSYDNKLLFLVEYLGEKSGIKIIDNELEVSKEASLPTIKTVTHSL